MYIELSHDVIAEKIWERLPENDKRSREIERSIQQRTRDFQQEHGSYLGNRELEAWKDVLGKIQLSAEEQLFLEKSRKHWKTQRLTWTALFSAVVLVALALSWFNMRTTRLEDANDKNAKMQYDAAIEVWSKLQGFPFFAEVQDSITRAKTNSDLRDRYETAKMKADSLFITGDLLHAKQSYQEANDLKFGDDLTDLIDRTENARQLNLELFKRKAEVFTKANACLEACIYLKKALNLEPDDTKLVKKYEACACDGFQ